MEYNEGNIQLMMERHCPTDCLIIKGYYNAITLAVYGHVNSELPPQIQQQSSQPVKSVEGGFYNTENSIYFGVIFIKVSCKW